MALVMQSGADGFDFSMLREVPQRVVNAGPVSFPFDLVDVEIFGESYSLDFPGLDANSGLAAVLRDGRALGVMGDDIRFAGNGLLQSGMATLLLGFEDEEPEFMLAGVSVEVSRLIAVGRTATTQDDSALLAELLRGDDVMLGNDDYATDDVLNGRGGRDVLGGYAGDDRLAGGRGDDVLLGGAGRDTLEGGAGQDILLADAGNDILRGGFGNDVLAALMGAHGLTGGKGRDIFGFGAGSIGSVIRDFRDGTDRIAFDIEGLTFADLRITQLGPDVVRVAGDGFAFRVAGLRVEDLGRADFLFGTAAQDSVAASLDAFLDGWAYSV